MGICLRETPSAVILSLSTTDPAIAQRHFSQSRLTVRLMVIEKTNQDHCQPNAPNHFSQQMPSSFVRISTFRKQNHRFRKVMSPFYQLRIKILKVFFHSLQLKLRPDDISRQSSESMSSVI